MTKEINLVHDNNLLDFLRNIKMLDSIHNGKVKCKFCKDKMTVDNINSIFSEEKTIKFCCVTPKCITDFSEYLNNKNEI